jgi:hypothetical protein
MKIHKFPSLLHLRYHSLYVGDFSVLKQHRELFTPATCLLAVQHRDKQLHNSNDGTCKGTRSICATSCYWTFKTCDKQERKQKQAKMRRLEYHAALLLSVAHGSRSAVQQNGTVFTRSHRCTSWPSWIYTHNTSYFSVMYLTKMFTSAYEWSFILRVSIQNFVCTTNFSPWWSFPFSRYDTHLQLVPRSRKCGSIHSLPHTPSWRSA